MSQQAHWKDTLWPTIAASGETIVDMPGTTAMIVPIGDDSERPAAPINGMLRYSTTSSEFEVYNGGWDIVPSLSGVTLSKLEDGDNNTEIFVENFSGVDDNTIAFTLGDNTGTFVLPASVLNWSTGGFDILTPTGNAAQAGVSFSITTGDGNVAAKGGNISFSAGVGGASGDGGDIVLTPGDASGNTGDGGNLNMFAGEGGDSEGSPGNISMVAGDAGVESNSTGGDVNITGGVGDNSDGGFVILTGGTTDFGVGGEIRLIPGVSVSAAGAPFTVTGGAGDGAANVGGSITLTGGQGDAANGPGGFVNIVGGLGGTGTGGGGGVNIVGGSPPTSGAGGDVIVAGGPGALIAAGGAVTIAGGNADTVGVGGTVIIAAGNGGSISGVGGAMIIAPGAGGTGDVGGAMTLSTGDGDGSSGAGDFTLATGDGGGGGGSSGGDIIVSTGTGISAAGNIGLTAGNSAGLAGNITLTAGTGGTDGALLFETGGASRFAVADDGTLEAKTASYETLVLSDQDMTNKKYVDDSISGAPHPYDINAVMQFPPLPAGARILTFPIVRPVTLPAGPGHFAFCDAATTGTVGIASFDILKSSPGGTPPGPPIGTVTFAIGALVGVVTVGAPVGFAAGDELFIVYTTPDTGATLANVGITLFCTTP